LQKQFTHKNIFFNNKIINFLTHCFCYIYCENKISQYAYFQSKKTNSAPQTMNNKALNNINILTCHSDYWNNILTNSGVLSYSEKEKSGKYKVDDDRKRFCVARIIARSIASDYLGIESSEIPIEINSLGKPYIQNTNDFFFNISHSGNWVAIAFAPFNIGVDVQQTDANKKININNVAKHSFHQDEIDYLNKAINNNNKEQKFYEIWSIKEAVIKATGKQFFGCPQKFSVLKRNQTKNDSVTIIDDITYYYNYIDSGYVLSVATCQNIDNEIIIQDFKGFS